MQDLARPLAATKMTKLFALEWQLLRRNFITLIFYAAYVMEYIPSIRCHTSR